MTNERAYTPSLVLHVLRNPHGWSVEAITAARLQAADEIERLQKIVDLLCMIKGCTLPRNHSGYCNSFTHEPGAGETFRAGVTQAKYRFHYKEALEKIVKSYHPSGNPVFLHDIAVAALNSSPEHEDLEGASRDASPADLVGALQDAVHTDPGPVRAGKAHRDYRAVHEVWQGESGDYVWHQSCQCSRCRAEYERLLALQNAQRTGE